MKSYNTAVKKILPQCELVDLKKSHTEKLLPVTRDQIVKKHFAVSYRDQMDDLSIMNQSTDKVSVIISPRQTRVVLLFDVPLDDDLIKQELNSLYYLIDKTLHSDFWLNKAWQPKVLSCFLIKKSLPSMIDVMREFRKSVGFMKKPSMEKIKQICTYARIALEYTGMSSGLTKCFSKKPYERLDETQKYYEVLGNICLADLASIKKSYDSLLEWHKTYIAPNDKKYVSLKTILPK